MWQSVVDGSQSQSMSIASLLRSVRRVRDESSDDSDPPLLNPLGTVVQNPEVDSSTCLTIYFVSTTEDERSVFYPSLRSIVDRLELQRSADSQVPSEQPPNLIWLDSSEFNNPAFAAPSPMDCTAQSNANDLCSPHLRSPFFRSSGEFSSTFSHELRPRSNSSCEQSIRSNGSRPDSGEFVPVQPITDQGPNGRPNSDESGRLAVPGSFANRSSSLCNLSILASIDRVGKTNSESTCVTQTASSLSLQIPRSCSMSSSNDELRRNVPVSGRKASKAYLQQLREICCKDPLHELSKGDIELVWYLRGLCRTQLPHSLSHLLAGITWNRSDQVLEMLALLAHWPLLSPEHGLQLLDYAYCDLHVRRFAVRCLAQMSDEQLFLYLLQLVQALKFESYLHSELGTFLLHRALANQHIGHYLFWLLRSEMHEPCVSIKFGLLLEACKYLHLHQAWVRSNYRFNCRLSRGAGAHEDSDQAIGNAEQVP
jgi:hypothetical protein